MTRSKFFFLKQPPCLEGIVKTLLPTEKLTETCLEQVQGYLWMHILSIFQNGCLQVKGFSKVYNFSFYEQIFFCKHFYYIIGFCVKKINFCKLANFFADSKIRAQELSNDFQSFVIFGHQTWDLEGGGSNWPPQHILVFKYPSRDRVKGDCQ